MAEHQGSTAFDAAMSSLKAKFHELDVNRDGMLDRAELAVLLRKGLPDMTDREIRGLFLCVDTDGSGAVLFDEFVDFLFAPPGGAELPEDTRPPGQLLDPAELEALQAAAEARKAGGGPALGRAEVRGASYHPELNGEYVRKATLFTGRPVFARSDPPGAIFYGSTPGRRRVGWFMASRVPPPGPVMKYTVCNQTACAETPDLCCSAWETFGGNPDKRMFCLAADRGAGEPDGGAGAGEGSGGSGVGLLEDELFEAGPAPAGSRDGLDGELEEELEEETGEDAEDPDGQEAQPGDPRWAEEGEAAPGLDPDAHPGCQGELLDPEFPPEESSLGSSMGIHDLDPSLCVADRWTRLPQLHEAPCLFRGGAAPEDVRCAASAENGWFLSAVVAVAEFPAWVRSIFAPAAALQPDGRYAVRLYHPGRRRFLRVVVDDLVPTKGGAPAFAGVTPDGELWVALLEKAFAKLCGSYARTAGGATAFGLLYLCGGAAAESWSSAEQPGRWRRSHAQWRRRAPRAPGAAVDRSLEALVEDWALCDDERLWALLRDFTRLGYPAACAARPARVAARGLAPGRGYTLVSTREVPVGGRLLRMVFLRDPFGAGGWSGRWGADSELWAANPAIRAALQFRPAGDGTFWMSFCDFARYFQTVDVVRKAMPLQGCHKVKLAEFRVESGDDGAGSFGGFDLPSLPTSP